MYACHLSVLIVCVLDPTPSPSLCSMAVFMWSLHYTKRLLETALVHRFSHATMPIRNLFKVSEWHLCPLLGSLQGIVHGTD